MNSSTPSSFSSSLSTPTPTMKNNEAYCATASAHRAEAGSTPSDVGNTQRVVPRSGRFKMDKHGFTLRALSILQRAYDRCARHVITLLNYNILTSSTGGFVVVVREAAFATRTVSVASTVYSATTTSGTKYKSAPQRSKPHSNHRVLNEVSKTSAGWNTGVMPAELDQKRR